MQKTNRILLITLVSLILSSCESSDNKNTSGMSPTKGLSIANPITYKVLVRNPDTDDEWQASCLENTDIKSMSKDIIKAAITGKLKAYSYHDNHLLSKSEIEAILEKNGKQNKIGNIQFKEEWYWDKNKLQLHKKIKSLMFGYEIYDEDKKVKGYRASFVVNLNEN